MIEELTARLSPLQPPATEASIAAVERSLGLRLPEDYREFLLVTNGFVGSPHENHYVQFFPIEELVDAQAYTEGSQRKGLLCFGTDGGGEGYFFDFTTQGPRVLMIAFMSDWYADALWHGDSLTDFLGRLVDGWSPFDEPRHG